MKCRGVMITLKRRGDGEVPQNFARHRRSDADVPPFLLEMWLP
ncbi:MAG: hypothetical protein AB1657_05140 [Candidatus Micrarchaeota archaeon]